jgi:signal transduction histidine kinase/streptogramin lyase
MPLAGYLLFLLLLNSTAMAQQQKIIFDHYGFKEGYISRGAWQVLKSQDGLLWVTGDAGLARYDGKTFTYYRHNLADSSTVANNRTYCIREDRRGRIWLSAETGLDMFDSKTEKFHHCYFTQDNKKVYTEFWAHDIYCDDETGTVWVATGMGLFYLNPGSCELIKAPAGGAAEKIAGSRFISIAKRGSNAGMWLCGSDGFCKYDTKTGKFTAYHIPAQDPLADNDDNLLTIYLDDNNTVWLGGLKRGLVSYNIATGTFTTYYYSDYSKEENTVFDITQTGRPGEENILWLSTSRGLAAFNRSSKKFTFYTTDFGDDINGVKGRTLNLYAGDKEALWIGADMGLHKYDYAKQLFQYVNMQQLQPSLANAYPLNDFCFEKNNDPGKEIAWISTAFHPVYKYHFADNKLERLPPAISKYVDEKYAGLQAMFIDHSNTFWVSIMSHGLIGFDIKANRLVCKEKTLFYKDDFVTAFAEDETGNLWLGTNNGLFVMDKSRKTATPIVQVNTLLDEKKIPKKIASTCTDPYGRTWFVIQEPEYLSVFGYYNNKTGRVKLFNQAVDREIPKAEVMGKAVYQNGCVYISTSDGLLVVDAAGDKEKFTMLGKPEGLLQNNLYQVLADGDGNIWCGGTFGISCYRPGKKTFTNFPYKEYGISDAYFQKTLALAPYSQNIILGDAASFNYFNPKNIQPQPPPPVIFNSFSVFGKPLYTYNQLLPRPDIQLQHNQNGISVEFAALSYSKSDQNQYSWMLEGLEKEWHVSNSNIASYNNLAPGKYKLLVKAANSRGEWTPVPVTLSFSIKPPFYKTWWFILLVITVIASAVSYLVQLRIKRIKDKYQLRNKIAGDLHDEIGSTITSINILSNVSQQAMDKDPQQAREMLSQIALQSKQIQQNMSDIVWSIRPDNEKLENLLVRMKEYVAQTLEPLQITTRFSMTGQLTDLVLPLHYRKEVLLIFKEAINNIAKHAGATEVHISILQTKRVLTMNITDNGRWNYNGSSTGTGTKSMQQRALLMGGSLTIEKGENGSTVMLNVNLA